MAMLKLMSPAVDRQQDQSTEKNKKNLCDLRSFNGHSDSVTRRYDSVVI